jgi:hypothetical protein
MGCREDYYKFTHHLMPHTIFNYGRLLVYRMMRNEDEFIDNLKKTWLSIEVEKGDFKSDPPEFELNIINLNAEHTAIIITIPEAMEKQEAVYIGIIYDKDDNFRYFTYEIGEGNQHEKLYFLCEWTSNREHLNYGTHNDSNKAVFIKDVSDLLIYDLF